MTATTAVPRAFDPFEGDQSEVDRPDDRSEGPAVEGGSRAAVDPFAGPADDDQPGGAAKASAEGPLEGLNAGQREAAEAIDGPVLILAGAGTGKTQTLSKRAVHMIQSGVRPEGVLLVTFTTQAAREMRERVASFVGAETAGRMMILTFHALGLKCLRDRPDVAGLTETFEVADDAQAAALLLSALEGLNETAPGFLEDIAGAQEFEPLTERKDRMRVAFEISRAKSAGVAPADLETPDFEALADMANVDPAKAVALAVYETYQETLRTANRADFGDLVLWPARAMRNDEALRRRWAGRFTHCMADEFQDTGKAQYEILRALARDHGNIAVVGDDDQVIHGWASADVRFILEFTQEYPDARTVRLEENYRCTPRILRGAAALVRHNRARIDKQLRAAAAWADGDEGAPIRIVSVDTMRTEARLIAREIASGDASPENAEASVFLLYRMGLQSRELEEALIAEGVAYTMRGSPGFYAREEILDACAWARVLIADELEALLRVVNKPARGFGEKSRAALKAAARRGLGARAALTDRAVRKELSAAAVQRADELAEALSAGVYQLDEASWEGGPGGDAPGALLRPFLGECGYLEHWRSGPDPRGHERLVNLEDLCGVAIEAGTLRALLDRAERGRDRAVEDANVTLMTMHASKGLEADVVYCVGWAEALFPTGHAVAAEERRPRCEEMEAERRLAHVAMTRAKRRLTILAPSYHPFAAVSPLCRFIAEIPLEETVWERVEERRPDPFGAAATGPQIALARAIAGRRGLKAPHAAEAAVFLDRYAGYDLVARSQALPDADGPADPPPVQLRRLPPPVRAPAPAADGAPPPNGEGDA